MRSRPMSCPTMLSGKKEEERATNKATYGFGGPSRCSTATTTRWIRSCSRSAALLPFFLSLDRRHYKKRILSRRTPRRSSARFFFAEEEEDDDDDENETLQRLRRNFFFFAVVVETTATAAALPGTNS